MNKQILSGDEAVARGAYESGCTFAAAYPGTPSTEILENIAQYKQDIYCQWACNEKVATEMAIGASIGGARSLAAMKHVGMNVAADPVFTIAYCGVNGGLVVVSADDPGCHSSQNEQDNRLYAPHAKLMMLEPSDSQECKDFTKIAFELSERFDSVALLRMTTRVCHSKGLVELGERIEGGVKPYVRDGLKYAMLPAHARPAHIRREKILAQIEAYANTCELNRVEEASASKTGVITSGISYMHAREVFGGEVSYLKLGLTYPMPRKLITEFCAEYETLYVIEENEPYIENTVRALGFSCIGKDRIPICDELNAGIIRSALFGEQDAELYAAEAVAPPRPPVLCAGCPHRGFFYGLHKKNKKFVPMGDIGCYTLGIQPPLEAIDSVICMGAGLSSVIGLSKSLEMQGDTRKALGIVGDSTFFHSGITSLIDVFKTQANAVACILDNSTTAMTGHQQNAGTTLNLMGEEAPAVDLVSIVRAIGFSEKHIRIIDPLDLKSVEEALDAAAQVKGPFVIITKRPCALIKSVARQTAGKYCEVDREKCTGCKICQNIACPALSFSDKKAYVADTDSCTACGLCAQLCKFDAIKKAGAPA